MPSSYLLLSVHLLAYGAAPLVGAEAHWPGAPQPKPEPVFFRSTDAGCLIGIPDAKQCLRDLPKGSNGFCGEASMQMIALYYGVYLSQKSAFEIGYAKDKTYKWLDKVGFPHVLAALGLTSTMWWHRKDATLDEYLQWLTSQLKSGHPVLIGAKIYPTPRTARPEWVSDHFMVAVGFDQENLTFNTTWVRQETRSFKLMKTKEKGFSFVNDYGLCYGCAVTGVRDQEKTVPVHLYIDSETKGTVTLDIYATSLTPGKRYTLLRFDNLKDVPTTSFSPDKAAFARTFVARRPTNSGQQTLARHVIAIYRCVPQD